MKTVFISYDEERIYGVYETLEEALKQGYSVDEYILGTDDRIRGYTHTGELWWANGRDIRYSSSDSSALNASLPSK
jgi:hypothetical protein